MTIEQIKKVRKEVEKLISVDLPDIAENICNYINAEFLRDVAERSDDIGEIAKEVLEIQKIVSR